ncbi:hypothetical protein L226DRAFT_545227 [Lentinus tigrinus ALCF2SS1-7]|uniref:uncharacterized protein n=1 Tax=Lentinus tigrinus ALCF2SS1-7 TaxID=1328758 RepID=UPI0011663C2C|nr:hypothetical protein L226DRAFT_545227 [Lentinus tigrinus ALCF2SS1-7]
MSTRPHVPAAFHAELTEYSSLLRALRTSATADLTVHLTQGSLSSAAPSDDVPLVGEEEQEEGYATEDPPLTESIRDLSSAIGSSPPSSPVANRTPGKGKLRDTWTRWPLLAGDVHVPEFGLADEVRHITEYALASRKGQVPVPHDADNLLPGDSFPTPEEEDDQVAMSTLGLQAVTADASAFLARVLALVAAHVPAAEKSMQNRVRPISWETVVDVACVHGAIPPSIASTVRERMSRIYSPSQPSGIQRAEHLLAANDALVKILSKHNDDLLALPLPSTEKDKPVKRKRGPYKKRNASSEVDGESVKRARSEEG